MAALSVRIVTLTPYLAELVFSFGLGEQLLGVSHRSEYPEEVKDRVVLTKPGKKDVEGLTLLERVLCRDVVDLSSLRALEPDLVLTEDRLDGASVSECQEALRGLLDKNVKLSVYNPLTFEQILLLYEDVAKRLGVSSQGVSLRNRVEAQVKDWSEKFYDRTRGKKVTFLVGTDPLVLGGQWLPDLIHQTSAVSQFRIAGEQHRKIAWDDILEFRPDVIVVAPAGLSLRSSMRRLAFFEALPDWEELPAVKRGEVVFMDGKRYFNTPGPRITDSFGMLVSAIAGLESGYITERGSFQRLRWVEMHRHEL